MILGDVETWPTFLTNYLASQRDMFIAYRRHDQASMDAYLNQSGRHVSHTQMPPNPHSFARERAAMKILELLKDIRLRGWHCTRLTDNEVNYIKLHGMQPPDLLILGQRIRRLQDDGMISSQIAQQLMAKNQADEKYRKGMIWFCFFSPATEDQPGIECFFRYWGGEALYNSHDGDPVTGSALQTIGKPCLIEAEIPIAAFNSTTYLGDRVIRKYLISQGFGADEGWEHEDYTCDPIPAANIVRIIFHGEADFATFTGCDSWENPLA